MKLGKEKMYKLVKNLGYNVPAMENCEYSLGGNCEFFNFRENDISIVITNSVLYDALAVDNLSSVRLVNGVEYREVVNSLPKDDVIGEEQFQELLVNLGYGEKIQESRYTNDAFGECLEIEYQNGAFLMLLHHPGMRISIKYYMLGHFEQKEFYFKEYDKLIQKNYHVMKKE